MARARNIPWQMQAQNMNLQQKFNDPEMTTENVGARLARQNQLDRQQFYNALREQRQGNNMTTQRRTSDPRPGQGRRPQRRQTGNAPGMVDVEAGRPAPQARPLPTRTQPTPAEMGVAPTLQPQPQAAPIPSLAAQAQNPFASAMVGAGLLTETNTGLPQRMQGNTIRPSFTYGLTPDSPMWANAPQQGPGSPFDYYAAFGQGVNVANPPGPNVPRAPGSVGHQGVYRQWPSWEMTPEVMSGLMQQYGDPMGNMMAGGISPMALKQQHGVMPFASSGWPSPELFTQQGLQQPVPTPFGVPWRR
tara:strand:+ start:810 stop:1718 length:909 start_codon:yes stop_codon:yes gene_type:complete